jgi:hypothetical protein
MPISYDGHEGDILGVTRAKIGMALRHYSAACRTARFLTGRRSITSRRNLPV